VNVDSPTAEYVVETCAASAGAATRTTATAAERRIKGQTL
jgi:hypothetical protein